MSVVSREDVILFVKHFNEERDELPSTRAICGGLDITSRELYKLFPGGVPEICEACQLPLPENRLRAREKPAEKPPLERGGAGGIRQKFEEMIGEHELEEQRFALIVVADGYRDEADQLGSVALASKFGFLGELVEKTENSHDLGECSNILDELTRELGLLQSRREFRGEVENEFSSLERHIKEMGVVGKTLLDHAELLQLKLGWTVEQVDSCSSVRDINSLRKFFREVAFEVSKLVEGAKKQQLAEREKREREWLFARAVAKYDRFAWFYPPWKREWFFKRLRGDPSFVRVYLSAPF